MAQLNKRSKSMTCRYRQGPITSGSSLTIYAQLAQLVEQRTENPRVSGSIPELGIYCTYQHTYVNKLINVTFILNSGDVAQLVEHLTFNQVVGSSSLLILITTVGFLPIVFF